MSIIRFNSPALALLLKAVNRFGFEIVGALSSE